MSAGKLGKSWLYRVYRGFLPLDTRPYDEVTLYVEADDYAAAVALMKAFAKTVHRDDGDELYNVWSARECAEWHPEVDPVAAIFKTGSRDTSWAESPVFLVRDPTAFAAKLAELRGCEPCSDQGGDTNLDLFEVRS